MYHRVCHKFLLTVRWMKYLPVLGLNKVGHGGGIEGLMGVYN